MGKDIDINNKIQNYILDLSKKLHPVQSEIISYNESLGDIKRMQIAVSQCYFLELITKVSKAKKILEIGTFTGLSTCLLYTSPSPRDSDSSRMPSSA